MVYKPGSETPNFRYSRLKAYTYFLISFCFLTLALSCSTTRKKEDVKGIKKLYHNTTAKFNGYFNAEELIDETMLKLQEMHVDNYNSILDVYDYIEVDNPQSIKEDMDKAIEKVSVVATVHDVSNYVDDCYLIIGKAQYIKQDYIAAEETFQYFEEMFDPKNPYGRAYNSSSRNSTSGRKSKKEIKQERKEKENEREEKKKARDDERKDKEKQKKEEAKQRERDKKDRRKAASKGRSSSSKKRLSREERDKLRQEEAQKDEMKNVMSEAESKVSDAEIEALQQARETMLEEQKEEEARREKLEKEKEEQKKKEEEKYKNQGEGAIFKNRSAYTMGLYWLGRTYIETERFSSADFIFRELEKTPGLKDELANMIPAAKAHMCLKTKEYGNALEYLEEAIDKEKDRNKRARYAFIMAQIYERVNANPRAYDSYKRAKKFSTDYELDFNAILNETKLAYTEGSSSRKKTLNKLNNILAERKNQPYQDQIYFTLAQIKLDEGDIEGAIADFEMAIGSSGNNKNVTLEAYYRLAELLFENGFYTEAKTNYEEALKIMSKNDDRYRSVERLSENLNDIAENINTVELQDSLLELSKLSEADLRDVARSIVEERKASGETVDPDKTDDLRKSNIISSNRQLGAGRSNFFAYNPVALNQGKLEFARIWGDRVLEDNWRRSLRSNAGLTAEDIVGELDDQEEEVVTEEELREVLKDIPRNPTQIASAEKRIQNALFQLGVLFRERIRNYEKSIEVLERLTNEYPDYERRDEALFYLYLSYLELDNDAKANSMLAELRRNYPESKFTKLATDPTYAQALKDKEDSIEKYYDKTYTAFEDGEHETVLSLIGEKDKLYGRNKTYNAKFDLLKAISTGKVQGKQAYIDGLQQVIRSYPNSPEETRAREILRFLKGDQEAFDQIIYEEALEAFEIAPEKQHYVFVVTYDMDQRTFDNTKVEILNYNKKFHRFDNLKISNIYLNQQNKARIILIRSFENQEKAMKYYEGVQKNKELFIRDPQLGYDIFPVTQKNYREVIKQKGITNYRAFFLQTYLSDKEN